MTYLVSFFQVDSDLAAKEPGTTIVDFASAESHIIIDIYKASIRDLVNTHDCRIAPDLLDCHPLQLWIHNLAKPCDVGVDYQTMSGVIRCVIDDLPVDSRPLNRQTAGIGHG